jgi:hypothetical protein
MDTLPWFVWIVFAGMAFGLTMAILAAVHEQQRKLAKIRASGDSSNAKAVNAQVLTKLEEIEARLATIEKTLTDIP